MHLVMKRNLAALLILGILCCLSCGERETKLFNGKDLTGWTFHVNPESDVPAAEVFGVRDGVITVAGQPFGYMMTEQSFRDYRLHVEWRWVGEPTNSGIFLHGEPTDGLWPRCAEVNLMAGHAGDMIALGGAGIDELKETGGIFKRSPVEESAENPAGEWNTAEIICQGNFIRAYINGVLKNEAHFERAEGPISLQSEGGPLEFRNVYVTAVKK